VIKIDIEGYESLVLRGMEKTIERHKPIIVTEFSPWHIQHRTEIDPQDYLRQLCQYGYDSIIEPSGGATLAPNTNFIMDFWENFNNDKQNLDLIARPREK